MGMEASSIVNIVGSSIGIVVMLAIMAVIAGVIISPRMRPSAVKTASLPSRHGKGRALGKSYVAKKENQWLCAEKRAIGDKSDQKHLKGYQLGGSGTGESCLVKK